VGINNRVEQEESWKEKEGGEQQLTATLKGKKGEETTNTPVAQGITIEFSWMKSGRKGGRENSNFTLP
jgi:hypothetical protein